MFHNLLKCSQHLHAMHPTFDVLLFHTVTGSVCYVKSPLTYLSSETVKLEGKEVIKYVLSPG